jgi:hypothetical protein
MPEDTALAERVARHLAAIQPEPSKEPPDRRPLPVFHNARFRCPAPGCGSPKFVSNRMRSKRQPDGTSVQIKVCSRCGFTFVLKVK